MTRCIVAGIGTLTIGVVAILNAQSLTAQSQHSSTSATVGERAPFGNTPTWFTPAPNNFTRYDNAVVCLQAVARVWFQHTRSGWYDTVPKYVRPTDSILPEMRHVAQQCGESISLERTRVYDLSYMMQLLLYSGQSARIRPLIASYMAQVKTAPERARILYDAMIIHLNARPVQLAETQAFLAQLDSLGPEARLARAAGHRAMVSYFSVNFDSASLRREAEVLRTLYEKAFTQEERDLWLLGSDAYFPLITLLTYQHRAPDSLMAALTRLLADAGTVKGVNMGEQMQSLMQIPAIRMLVNREPVLPILAKYWYGANAQGVHPAPGRVTFILHVDPNCGVTCYPKFATLERLNRKYASRGFDVLYVTKTVG